MSFLQKSLKNIKKLLHSCTVYICILMYVNKLLIKPIKPVLNLVFKWTFPFCDLGIFAIPQCLKQESDISKKGGITFSWKEIDCEQMNGVFLGYEIKLYYRNKVCTEKVDVSVTTFTVQPNWKPKFSFPKAISVAVINEVGVGSHCPPVKINLHPFGENKIDFACTKCKNNQRFV